MENKETLNVRRVINSNATWGGGSRGCLALPAPFSKINRVCVTHWHVPNSHIKGGREEGAKFPGKKTNVESRSLSFALC